MSVYHALSLSTALSWLLNTPEVPCHVLSVHDRACNLLTSDEQVISLVHPSVGNGPFHAIVPLPSPFTAYTVPQEEGVVVGGRLSLGALFVDLRRASLWSPHLPLRPARLSQRQVGEVITRTRVGYKRESPLVEEVARAKVGALLPVLVEQVMAGGDEGRVEAILQEIIGLGPGLTPAGDDVVLGVLAGMWIWGEGVMSLARVAALVERVAHTGTHRLSRAWLKAAGEGAFAEHWHHLATAIATGEVEKVAESAARILDTGATSGAFALEGFLAVTMYPRS